MKRLMIIPAAGLASRLKSSIPKILFPVNGRCMVDYLFDLYAETVESFIVVLHPSFKKEVMEYCATRFLKIEYVVQESPTGMLDAILIPQDYVRNYQPGNIWITWCDQIAIHHQTIKNLVNISNKEPDTALIFPTAKKKNPYIHLVRNEHNEIKGVLHYREGDNMPKVGESDMGLFCLSNDAYLRLLTDFSCEVGKGKTTMERNFLPFIPWLYGRAKVLTFSCHDEIESLGINTQSDLHQIEKYFNNKVK